MSFYCGNGRDEYTKCTVEVIGVARLNKLTIPANSGRNAKSARFKFTAQAEWITRSIFSLSDFVFVLISAKLW